uniref:Paramyosin n=1 Tax=Hirondellea gigas TaxID=1518452 RepID=A0A6A7G8A1_9CRUS
MRKIKKNAKLAAHKLDAAGLALQFVSQQGIEMKVAPSAENIVEGDVKLILGLIWGLMRKFIRFSDDDSGPNPQEALLMWVNNQIASYNLPKVERFPGGFHNGMALCAVLHKHRPKLIDMDSLNPLDGPGNLRKAFVGAERYFDLEQFLTPEEFVKLDDKSMFIYVSEYFYGVARMRKFELAAKRITRLVDYTRVNDQMKEDFKAKAEALRLHLDRVMKILNDRAIDNTMAGARHKLAEFSNYKEKDKSEIAGQYLDVESFYNHLAMRLSDHKRPAYNPPHETSLPGLNDTFRQLELTEQERSVALRSELNRQIKLVQLSEHHAKLSVKFHAFSDIKTRYLNERETITTTNEASFHINTLNTFDDESKAFQEENDRSMKEISDNLQSEKYENISDVRNLESAVIDRFVQLCDLSAAKRLILDDHLARETFNEKFRLDDGQHVIICETITSFHGAKSAYLNVKESVNSVDEARSKLSELEACLIEVKEFESATVPGMKELGVKINDSVYQTEISSSHFANEKAALNGREVTVDAHFVELQDLYSAKLVILEDDMAREVFTLNVRLQNLNHIKSFESLSSWCNEKASYLNHKESVNSISDAQLHLSGLEAFVREKNDQLKHFVRNLQELGHEITFARYDNLSQWQFETPEEITQRESKVDDLFAELARLHVTKKDVLDDDLAREEFKAHVLLLNDRHVGSFNSISSWCDDKDAYLDTKEDIDSIADANLQISRLEEFCSDQRDAARHNVSLNKLGEEIRSSRYERLSVYVYEDPDSVLGRDNQIADRFSTLTEKTATKDQVLKDALDLEIRKEANRVRYATLAADLRRWVKATSESSADSHFGFTLAEVESFSDVLEKQDAELAQQAESKESGAQTVLDAGIALGVKENAYTEETPQSLAQSCVNLSNALSVRRNAYQTELQTQRDNDDLCKKFADEITTFSDSLTAQRTMFASSSDDLEVQLESVTAKHESKDEDDKLPSIEALQSEIDSRGITNNRHTFMSTQDVRVLLEQFKTFLFRKAKMLSEEIDQKKLKGLTLEQYAQIEDQFKQFDADSSGQLSPNEIKACLFSLGEEVSNKQVKKILNDFGNECKEELTEEGFKNFMIGVLGVSAALPEDITSGFKLINRGAEFATTERMDLLTDQDLDFITKTAPAKGDGWDYDAWVNEVFAR